MEWEERQRAQAPADGRLAAAIARYFAKARPTRTRVDRSNELSLCIGPISFRAKRTIARKSMTQKKKWPLARKLSRHRQK
jgi:hypothetical protein